MISHSAWPVDPGVIVPFLLAVALIELTPGPNMVWLALVSVANDGAARSVQVDAFVKQAMAVSPDADFSYDDHDLRLTRALRVSPSA
ncbi:hypothetical protein [Brevundimonas sp.]|uniref:hypothetical protein n=1 Tax=Brevundimonas sp. TaxID=1871086 RepID=UPI0035687682